MKYNETGVNRKCNRSNKDSARFAKAFEDACCRNPNVSCANIAVRILTGEGSHSYITDTEFAAGLDAFRCKKPSSSSIVNAFLNIFKSSETKARTYEQSMAFGKKLKHVLKHSPEVFIGQVLAEIAIGKNYCSLHTDEDLIRRAESF